ncbi:MAG TPA: serine/threonine-protein kinase, partial [Sandaracinaceae bacterium LLY-WYZ-13_1]|nr:serine/threonine-protein kinase [Sandaracinaceae bacterium LLY-WYZ-13_1]
MTSAADERRRFGRYETLFRIAGGGMAEVYAARALGEGGFQKLVALKRMRPELTEDARFVTMFLDEGRLAANIASPHVVSTLDLGRADDNSLYLVMELVTGAPLSALMAETRKRSDRVPTGIGCDVVAQAAAGLHAAHEARSPTGEPLEIVHRDCSPHNILVDLQGQVKITDFGIAKAMERQTRSHAGEMKGKLQYLSPEQARGRPVDRRADIFILGVVAWEVLAGRQLFVADNPVEALHKVVTMPIPRLDEVAEVDGDVAAAVAQALVRDPDERYSTALAFGNALRNAMGASRPNASDVGAWVRRYGGESLHTVEGGIREALGGKSEPPPPSAEPPIPLAVRSEGRVDDVRARARTVPSVPPPTEPDDTALPAPAPIPGTRAPVSETTTPAPSRP